MITPLNSPIDMMEIGFGRVQYLLSVPDPGATQFRFQYRLPEISISKLQFMDRTLAFCLSLGHEVFGINRALRNWDRLARNGNMLKPCSKNSGILLTVIALRIGDRSLSDSESSKSDMSSTK
jgi:hypothetical protein